MWRVTPRARGRAQGGGRAPGPPHGFPVALTLPKPAASAGNGASIRLLFGVVLHNGLITGSSVGAERKQTLHWKCYSALDMPVDYFDCCV